MGKVTLKSNGDEALSDEFLLKSNGNEALNGVFLWKLTAMKRLTLRRNRNDEALKRLTMLKNWGNEAFNASSLHCFIAVNTIYVHAEIAKKKQGKTLPHKWKGKDDGVFWLCYWKCYEK